MSENRKKKQQNWIAYLWKWTNEGFGDLQSTIAIGERDRESMGANPNRCKERREDVERAWVKFLSVKKNEMSLVVGPHRQLESSHPSIYGLRVGLKQV